MSLADKCRVIWQQLVEKQMKLSLVRHYAIKLAYTFVLLDLGLGGAATQLWSDNFSSSG
jgi:hypothetical protein